MTLPIANPGPHRIDPRLAADDLASALERQVEADAPVLAELGRCNVYHDWDPELGPMIGANDRSRDAIQRYRGNR